MHRDLSTSEIETLLATRPGYQMTEDCPHTEQIAQMAATEASLADITAAYPHLLECDLCREAVTLFLEMPDAQLEIDAGYTAPLPPPDQSIKRWIFAIAALLLTGIIGGIGVAIWHQVTRPSSPPTTLSPKGAAFDLEIAVSRNGSGFPLQPGHMVETGDRLGFFYSASQSAYLALFHLTAEREISTLFPARNDYNVYVKNGTRIPVEDGAVVTPAASCEWIVAIFTQEKMSINRLSKYLNSNMTINTTNPGCNLRIDQRGDMTIRNQQIRR